MVGDPRMKDPELIVQYFPDSDTLRLSAGVSPAEGETIAKWLMVEWSHDEEITGVVLRNAAKVLRPYLFPDSPTPDNSLAVIPENTVIPAKAGNDDNSYPHS